QGMAARDVEPVGVRAARHFAEELGRQMIGGRVALVLFAGQGTVRYPATTDPRILGEVLDNSGRGVKLQQGSSLRSGLESSLGAFPADLDPLRQRAIVLVSDGEITNSDVPEASDLVGARIYTVGVGTEAGGQIPTYDANDGKFTGYLRDAGGVAALSNETANGLFAGGNYAGALAAYRDLQLDQPDSPELAINAANALHKMAEYPRALAEYGKAIDGKDLHLRAIAQYDRGNTLFRMGRYEDARDAYREALRMDPTDRDAKFNLEIVQRILSARPAQPGQQSGPGPRQPGSPNPGAQGPGQSGQPSAG